ncbi:hypothetical protein [Terrabacter sp. 2YAF2]|uniref:hypothetical protein n=1 Tax=Terrabacter sp. 2YAF2 TaxID=3233026 RepID=UPI003F9CE8CE
MNEGPSGDQEAAEVPQPVEPVESVLVEGSGRRVRDQRIGLVFAGLAVAALLVGGLIALVLAMAG